MTEQILSTQLIQLTSQIVAAYVSNNEIRSSELPQLIGDTHSALALASGLLTESEKESPKPKVPIKKSVTDDFIVCLEDGKKFKSLKRHIRTHYNLSPDEYRARWNLPHDYPMVAPNYARERSKLARRMGLGKRKQR